MRNLAVAFDFPADVQPRMAQLFHHAFGGQGSLVAEIDLAEAGLSAIDPTEPTEILEWIYRQTNSIEHLWSDAGVRHPAIRLSRIVEIEGGARSTSTGDQVLFLGVHPRHGQLLAMSRWVCDTVGWSRLPVEETMA